MITKIKQDLISYSNIDLTELIKLLVLKDISKLILNKNKENINIFIMNFSKLGGFLHMKIDEFLFKNLDYLNNYLDNVLLIRFYQFSNNTITVGRLQKITQDIINQNKDYLIVKRITGGKAVYHLPKKDLTFSVIANTNIFKKLNTKNQNILIFIHSFFNNIVKETLISLNINLDNNRGPNNFKSFNIDKFDCFARPMDFELVYNNKKIVGSAVKIDNNKFILQANIKLYLIDNSLSDPKFIDKFINEFIKFFINKFYINLNLLFTGNLIN
ncbi:MAG: lipoyl protein ligase domain-containing protein [bacterium]